ncbi:MAG: dihydroneopterin triphosphate diphosphatase [Nitrosomonas sp.]|uniref:dihydroneopterin triphosphate diphosphatase n=1 Tax=Nitrosomonas sp. TaxID=42353 RepID=UPI0025EEFA20|nr:dihydroneopterin triphosphate diphosphatase [Nitrosomonas sp.]MBY0475353.1 dihydroneopterin triphosphate diphosphatase [Nitrosomonas sp.]
MYKTPVSVLVVIHTLDLQVLLLERADHPGFWQSVTGSQDSGETLLQTAMREVSEETGLNPTDYVLTNWQIENCYEIYQEWRWRYGPDVKFNIEHVFGLCLPDITPIMIAAKEHLNYIWLPWQQAAEKVFSSSNAEAILKLPVRAQFAQVDT